MTRELGRLFGPLTEPAPGPDRRPIGRQAAQAARRLRTQRRAAGLTVTMLLLSTSGCWDDVGGLEATSVTRVYDVFADTADASPVGEDALGLPDADTSGSADTLQEDVDTGDTSVPAGACAVAADCHALPVGPCEVGACIGGECLPSAAPLATPCTDGGVEGLCMQASCVFACGDGIVQESLGESCDDGGNVDGDGCSASCVVEEPIGAGFTGGQCAASSACGPSGAVCIQGVAGGSCAVACDQFCSDAPESPTTFCIAAAAYASRLPAGTALPSELSPALCVSKCDFDRFPRSGCRSGLHCELHTRYQSLVADEVCVPGPWTIGLEQDASGAVTGVAPSGPSPTEPYAQLASTSCPGPAGANDAIPAELFFGLATTLLAMDADGRDMTWQRLCSPPSDLPNVYAMHTEASAGRAFRLNGVRLDVIDWTAAAIYGSKGARRELVGGPLYRSRVMVHRAGGMSTLYADAAADHPYWDPARGRHFGMINGDEWRPLDSTLEPHVDYVTIKVDGTHGFYKQWGRVDTVEYVADMALSNVAAFGVPVGVGDLSLPTGGDIVGHGSHETGLDADLYLLTYPPGDGTGGHDLDQPSLWVSTCSGGGSSWTCSYVNNSGGGAEPAPAPGAPSVSQLLANLAQFALDNPGMSHFVQHDVETLAPFVAQQTGQTSFVDAASDGPSGWPLHANHIHVRFYDWP